MDRRHFIASVLAAGAAPLAISAEDHGDNDIAEKGREIIIINTLSPSDNIEDIVARSIKKLSDDQILADADGRPLNTANILA